VKIRERNEGLDLEVYNLAALYVMGLKFIAGLARLAEELSRPFDGKKPPDGDNAPPAPGGRDGGSWMGGRGGRGWVNRW
jgi:phage terminase large subunit GpA-like protein